MDNALTALLSMQFVFFGLMLAALTWVARKVVEYFMKKGYLHAGNIWSELVLPVLPVLLGALIGLLAAKYPYPPGITSASARAVFGSVAGLLSGLVYRVLKSTLKAKITDSVKGTAPAEHAEEE